MPDKADSKFGNVEVSKTTKNVVQDLESDGRKVQVFGRLVNGKLELDHESLNEIARKFPNAEMAFVAVNAPFDPVASKANHTPSMS